MANQLSRPTLLDVLLPGDINSNSVSMIRMRWAAALLVLGATAFCVHVLGLPLPEMGLYVTGLVIIVYNAVLAALNARLHDDPQHAGQIVRVQVVLDWVSMALFLHFTGGICSPAIPFLLIHMLMVTILLPGQSPYLYVVMGTGLLAALTLAESTGLLPHFHVIPLLPRALYKNPIYIGSQLGFTAITALVIVYLTSNIMKRLREREQQIGALFDATSATSSTLSLPDVMQRLAQSAAEALGMKRASIRLLDESGERLDMTAAYGLSQDYLNKGPVELSYSQLDRDALLGEPVIIERATADPRMQYPREIAEEGIESIVVVPIVRKGRALGVLRVYSSQADCFRMEDAAFAMAIAQQGATALENAMAHEALQKAEQTRTQYIRLVTHELRSPVGGAQSLLRTLLAGLAGELSDQQRDILERVERRLDALLNLISDLLILAASKTPELGEAPRRLPLQRSVTQVVDRWRPEAAEKDIKLMCDVPFEMLPVLGTEEGLARIFDNLIGNAVKYTPEGGEVSVQVAERPAGAVITVSDTGIGIPAEEISCLWDEFYRASNARQSGLPGTGLGLSIVRQLVESYGGMVNVQSAEGKGTTFRVTLPIDHA